MSIKRDITEQVNISTVHASFGEAQDAANDFRESGYITGPVRRVYLTGEDTGYAFTWIS